MTLKELRQKRGELQKKMRDLVDKVEAEKRAWSTEDETQFKALADEDNGYRDAIIREERIASIESDLGRQERHGISRRTNPATGIDDGQHDDDDDDEQQRQNPKGPTEVERRFLTNSWARRQAGMQLTKKERALCEKYRFNPSQRYLSIPLAPLEEFQSVAEQMRDTHPRLLKKRDLSIGGGTSTGSGTIPTGFVNRLELAMLYNGPMLRTSEIMRTDSGNDLPWPTGNDTGNEGVLLAEATDFGSSVDPTLGLITLKSFKFSSKPIFMSEELMNDSAFNLDAIAGNLLGMRLGRIINKKTTIGAGTTEPKGIVVESGLGKTAVSATAIADTEILDLIHSVDIVYRELPTCGFMMNDGILLAVRKLKDSEGRFIFQSGLTLGVPDRLLGYPLWVNNHMQATVATGTKTMIFGDLNAYKIRQVRDVRLRRLNERYAELDQVAFIAFIRIDGRLVHGGVLPVKHLIQA